MWDAVSLIVGMVIGAIIVIIIFWATYHTRTLIYTTCPADTPVCLYQDYWNDPGNALSQNTNLSPSDILYLDSGTMKYKRVAKTSTCVPSATTQTVTIENPEYCSFTTSSSATFTGKNERFESPFYNGKLSDGTLVNVLSRGNCQPLRSETNPCPDLATCDIVVSGTPLIQWDPNTSLTETKAVLPPPLPLSM